MKSGGENFEKNEEWHNSDERLLIKNNKDPPNEDLNQINCDFGRNTQNNEEEYVRRPMNAFMVWSRSERRKLALKYPNMLNCEISKLLGAEWSKMSENDKKPYVQESKKLRTIHSQKYPEYSYRPRRKKRKSDTTNTFCNTSAVNSNGLSCYTLQNNELFDTSYTNGNYNNYGFYYDQYPNSSYLSGMENSSTPCQNSNYMSSYNRNDKLLNYFPSYQPNTYSNNFTDSFKVLAPFSTNDSNFQCGNYFSSIPYMQTTLPPAENLDKNVTYNYGTINTLFPEIVNNNSTEPIATETSKQNTTGIVQHQNVVASESCQPNIN